MPRTTHSRARPPGRQPKTQQSPHSGGPWVFSQWRYAASSITAHPDKPPTAPHPHHSASRTEHHARPQCRRDRRSGARGTPQTARARRSGQAPSRQAGLAAPPQFVAGRVQRLAFLNPSHRCSTSTSPAGTPAAPMPARCHWLQRHAPRWPDKCRHSRHSRRSSSSRSRATSW